MSPLQYLASIVQESRATQTEAAARGALMARMRQDDIFRSELTRFLLDHFNADLPCQLEIVSHTGEDRQVVYVCQGLHDDACHIQGESQTVADRVDACQGADESQGCNDRADATAACPKDSDSHTTADGGGCPEGRASQTSKDPASQGKAASQRTVDGGCPEGRASQAELDPAAKHYPRLNIDKSAAIRVATHQANTRRPPRRLWPHAVE